jgi:uncharacterized repeat protein (TIGR03806 family)
VLSMRPWMQTFLRLGGGLSILLGIAFVVGYHEICNLFSVPKPSLVWPLQAVGAITALLGVGYLFAAREPARHSRFLFVAFAFHAAVEIFLTHFATTGRFNFRLAGFVVAIAIVYLLPLAVIIFAPSKNRTATINPSRKAMLRIAWIAMLLVILLPPSWAVANAVGRTSTRWSMLERPAKWTPLKANLPAAVSEEFDFALVDCWPHLKFADPTFTCEMPDGSGRMIVLERRGRIRVFPKNSATTTDSDVFLDITARTMNVPGRMEDGLLGLAFHPHFADAKSSHRGEFFIRYTSDSGGKRTNRLSRFKVSEGGQHADEKSEVILIDMPEKTSIHKGGAVDFGNDGFLYATFGTDSQRFPHEHSQRINHGLWAGLLRIDVDCQGGEISHAPVSKPRVGLAANYFIPNNNPFVGQDGALEEFYSIGFRNPWRMSIDRATNRIWVGDVGDRHREEIDICTSGSNHQYDYLEGSAPVSEFGMNIKNPPQRPEHFIGVETPPVFEYDHDGLNKCVIGGYVYRGKKLPELVGKYVYADQCGRIYAITIDDAGKFVSNQLIAVVRTPGMGVSSLGVDADGELYVCWIHDLRARNSQVQRLDRAVHDPELQLPAQLSQTGLFQDLKTLEPNASLISYEINSPLWSDRAVKKRWIGLPSAEKISGDAAGRWAFPTGTVLVKHFDLPLDERETAANSSAAKVRRLETRVLVRDNKGGVYGASYRWNDDNSEAYLVNFSESEEIEYVDKDGVAQKQTWSYPGRLDCLSCHNSASPGVLGFNARQLNRDVAHNGLLENQLLKFSIAGMFTFDRTDAELMKLPKLVALNDKTASVETRVRSYLDANCSHCHLPTGRAALWDARLETTLARTNIIDGAAITHRGIDKRARVVEPGSLDWSFLYVRMASNDPALRMPPLARHVVHNEVVALVKEWILSMPAAKKDGQARVVPDRKSRPAEEDDDVEDDNIQASNPE